MEPADIIFRYCSLTYNTETIIRASRLQGQVFGPLSDAEPQLQTLIGLVTMNGFVMEHSHQRINQAENDISEVEARIGNLCSQQTGPVPMHPPRGNFRTAYEPLARVHMLWSVRFSVLEIE